MCMIRIKNEERRKSENMNKILKNTGINERYTKVKDE